MQLVYRGTGRAVGIGDKVRLNGEEYTILHFAKPHKPSSSGKVSLSREGHTREYYVGVIGAEWINREDRR